MIVEIDAGNSRIKWRVGLQGVYESRGTVINEDLELFFDELDKILSIKKIFISSVANLSFLSRMSRYSFKRKCLLFIAKTQKTTAGVICGYKDPSLLGIDRWLGIVAAYNCYKSPCVIVDAGTMLTIDIVNGIGKHLGGYILPGIEISREMINSNAAEIELGKVHTDYMVNLSPGKSTEECVTRGEFLMIRSLVRFIIEDLNEEKKVKIITTGGNGRELVSVLGKSACYEPELILDGLKLMDS